MVMHLHEGKVAQVVHAELPQTSLEVDRGGMERGRLVVRDGPHLSFDRVDREYLGIQPRR